MRQTALCFRSFPDRRVLHIHVRVVGVTFERRQAPPLLTYEAWKVQLRKDCEAEDKLLAFYSLGEYELKLLWGNGHPPTVQAIAGSIEP